MPGPQHGMRWTLQAASAAATARCGSKSSWRRCTFPFPFPCPEIETVTGTGNLEGVSIWPRRCGPPGPPGQQRPLSTSARHRAKAKPRGTSNPKEAPKEEEEGEKKATLSELLATRKTPLIAVGLAAVVMGGYITMLVISMTSGPDDTDDADDDAHGDCTARTLTHPSGRPRDLRQGRISAQRFDKDLNWPERRMGVTGLRKLMGGLARGHVLEVAVGTGRNIEYVDWSEIKLVAPPVAPVVVEEDGVDGEVGTTTRAAAAGGGGGGGVVKSEAQLEKERRVRRIEKGELPVTLPGKETPEVLSYTGVDVSADVLEVAWGKLKKAVPELIQQRRRRSHDAPEAEKHQPATPASTTSTSTTTSTTTTSGDEILAANIGQGRIRLYKSDAQLRLPAPPAVLSHDSRRVLPAPHHYDTILQNFGLCSVADPSALLANMARVLRPGSGRIYLLEHGRGSYGWLNGLLDKFAPAHFQRYGCWWNRDIEDIVRRAEQQVPGLEVVKIERPLWLQGGTMLWIELKVNPDKAQPEATSTSDGKQAEDGSKRKSPLAG